MMSTKELASVYDTIISIPGMGEQVKIDLKISRKNALLLSQAIRKGLHAKINEENPDLLDIVTSDCKQELTMLSDECLMKAGLTELSEKLLKL